MADRFKTRLLVTSFLTGVAVAGILTGAPDRAEAQTVLSIGSLDGLNTFLSGMDAALRAARVAGDSASAAGTGDLTVWHNPSEARSWSDSAAAADDPWTKANLKVVDLFTQMGGERMDRALVFRRGADGFSAAIDGMGAAWFAAAEAAQVGLLRQLVKDSAAVPTALKDAVADADAETLGDVVAAVAQAARSGVIFLTRGGTATVTIRDPQISVAGGAPFVLSPSGIVVGDIAVSGATQLSVALTAPGDIADGQHLLYVYNPGRALLAAAEFQISIANGATVAALPVSATAPASGVALLPANGSIDGRVASGQEAVYRFDLLAPAAVAVFRVKLPLPEQQWRTRR